MTPGPYFDDLTVGQVFRGAPALTLTEAHAVSHQAIVGDRLRLALDHRLSAEVTGAGPVAHPALVWDVAIGQSTIATQRVKANLFYRGLVFRRLPQIGDTLHTSTEVVGLRRNRARAGRAPTGLAVLLVSTADQSRRPVLAFWRCAMLPLRDEPSSVAPDMAPDRAPDMDLDHIGEPADPGALRAVTAGWRLDRFRDRVPGQHFGAVLPGREWVIDGGDVVSSAPELARVTLNVAMVHHDAGAAGGRRLVYGGHTIGIALAQASRALPNIVTVAGWHGCDHLAPVSEGDTLHSRLAVERTEPLEDGGLVHLRSRVRAVAEDGAERDVLDWRFVAVMA